MSTANSLVASSISSVRRAVRLYSAGGDLRVLILNRGHPSLALRPYRQERRPPGAPQMVTLHGRAVGQPRHCACKSSSDGLKNPSADRCSQSAIVDFKDGKQRRHGCRITPQAERPIPAKEGLKLD